MIEARTKSKMTECEFLPREPLPLQVETPIMSRKQTLSKARELCRQLRNKLYRVPDREEIEFMDRHKLWVSANAGSLPGDFAEQWRSVRKKLHHSIQKYEQAQIMSHGKARYQLTCEVADLRNDCWRVLQVTMTDIQQELVEVG